MASHPPPRAALPALAPDSNLAAAAATELAQWLSFLDSLQQLRIPTSMSLPRLVVCGGQSSGKSALLEGISGVQLPSKKAVCTRFPVHLALREGATRSLTATIAPATATETPERDQMLNWTRSHAGAWNAKLLTDIIREAAAAMGISGNAFARHVLRLELQSATTTPMDLVDLPGLFISQSGDQNLADATLVETVVKEYVADPSVVVLAVLKGDTDVTAQPATGVVQSIPGSEQRCLGILTHAERLEADPEDEGDQEFNAKMLRLARNQEGFNVFAHGWHVVHNRVGQKERHMGDEEFHHVEVDAIQNSAYKDLEPGRTTLRHLGRRIQEITLGLFRQSGPALLEQLQRELAKWRQQKQQLQTRKASLAAVDIHATVETIRDDLRAVCQAPAAHGPSQLDRLLGRTGAMFATNIKSAQVHRIFSDVSPDDGVLGDMIATPHDWAAVAQSIRDALGNFAERGRVSDGQILAAATSLFSEQSAKWSRCVDEFHHAVVETVEQQVTSVMGKRGLSQTEGAGQIVWDQLAGPRLAGLREDLTRTQHETFARLRERSRPSLVARPVLNQAIECVLQCQTDGQTGRAPAERGLSPPTIDYAGIFDTATVLIACEVHYKVRTFPQTHMTAPG